tara:strand:- start:1497 stop:1889 length:393 start_codon:yes stop_codon:yes gene_type:complete
MPITFIHKQDLLSIKVVDPIKEGDFDEYTRNLNIIFGLQKQFYLLIDLTELEEVPYKFIIKQGLYMKRMQKYVKKWVGASSVVFRKPSTANIINLAFSIKKPVKPNLITQDLKEAIDFLTKHKESIINMD